VTFVKSDSPSCDRNVNDFTLQPAKTAVWSGLERS
jgi:hypothetical protein